MDLGLADDWQHIIDSTSVRGHVSAAGRKGAVCDRSWSITRRFTSKIHARCDNQGLPVGSILTGGEASDYTAPEPLMAIPFTTSRALMADKGSDSDSFRESLLVQDILPIILSCSNRNVPEHPDYSRLSAPNRVERMFAKLKRQRRIGTRYDKTVLSYESFFNLAAARLWLMAFLKAA